MPDAEEPGPDSERNWVLPMRLRLQGMQEEACGGRRGGIQWHFHRRKLWEYLWPRCYWYHKARGASDDDASDRGAAGTECTVLAYENALPACLAKPDAWFGGVYSNCNRRAYIDDPLRPRPTPGGVPTAQPATGVTAAPEPVFVAPSAVLPLRIDDAALNIPSKSNVHDEAVDRDQRREWLRIAWRHVRLLEEQLGTVPGRNEQLCILVSGACDFYVARLNRISAGLGRASTQEEAERQISQVDPDSIIGLPEEDGELFESLYPLWPPWAGKEEYKVRISYDQAMSNLRRICIEVRAFEDAGREPLRIAWRHMMRLREQVGLIPEYDKQSRRLVESAIGFYSSRLDKVAEGLGAYANCGEAAKRIKLVPRDAEWGLPEMPREMFNFIRAASADLLAMPEDTAYAAYLAACEALYTDFGIKLRAFS